LKIRFSIAVSLLAILAMALAHGQSPPNTVRLDIPFKFMVGKQEMPAGKYEIVMSHGGVPNLQLRNRDTGKAMYIHVIERLAETNPSQKHGARVVFDTVGDQRFLSEFWPADNADGYLLGINKGEQKHAIVEEK